MYILNLPVEAVMIAKLFKSGNSLALRLPKELAEFFDGGEVEIHKGKNNTLVIEKLNTNWQDIFSKCYTPDFPEREEVNFSPREEL